MYISFSGEIEHVEQVGVDVLGCVRPKIYSLTPGIFESEHGEDNQ